MNNIKITLETLYDILRNEKKREDLQKLEDSFFFDIVTYLKEKKTFLETKTDQNSLFASGERDKLEYELRSIKRILKEIYEKREKKIIDIALNKSRTGSDIIDTSAMLREEKEFYQHIVKNLDDFRKGILLSLFQAKMPELLSQERKKNSEIEKISTDQSFEKNKETVEDTNNSNLDNDRKNNNKSDNKLNNNQIKEKNKEINVEKNVELNSKNTNLETVKNNNNNNEENKKEDVQKIKIRFIHPMPSFVWKDLKIYGPYDIGEEINIFQEVADLMIRKGRAEKI